MFSTPKKLLIIGGGFAGLECAKRLANDDRFEITVVDRTNHHLFQPLLYQVASASLSGPDIARSIRQILEDAKNITVLMDEISGIDRDAKTASGASGTVYSFDILVLAAGARTGFFGHEDWAKNTLGLKSLADAQNVRRTILSNLELAERCNNNQERARLMTIAIVGGGPTGVELAGAFADLAHRCLRTNYRRIDTSKLRIVLIQGSELILETFDHEQSIYARKRLEKLGVEVRINTRVVDVSEGLLSFKDGSNLQAAAIIWAAGVAANSLTACLGLPMDHSGRITPLPDLSVPSYPDIFLAGDLVGMKDSENKNVPGVAPAATQMGIHIANILMAEATGSIAKRPPFCYHDKGMMAIIGKNCAVAKTNQFSLQGFIAWIAWLFIHIMYLVGFRNKLSVLLGWAYAYVVNTPTARIITYPPTTTAPNSNS
jgi:NADH dehydrogenase